MRSNVRSLWLSLKASYWFLPTILTLLAVLLAWGTIYLDRIWGPDWLKAYGWFEVSRPEGARAQLTVIASAMIGVASTVFAITIAAVAYASGSYGPRLLTNFMQDRGNQLSLGTFIATFLYNLLVLRVVRNPKDTLAPGESVEAVGAFVPQLSMVVSGLSVFVSVAVLVYFLHHIPASIRINTVVGGIGRRLIRDIEQRFPVEGGSNEPPDLVRGNPVTARDVGYIKIIDFAELDEIARQNNVRLALCVRTGDFIHSHLPIMEVAGAEPDEELRHRLLQCFSLGDSRTPTQDLEFLMDELVEIALRALSPGINDPFTAITSLHWMGAALAKLANRSLNQGPEQEKYDPARVEPIADDFEHFLRRSLGGVRAAAASNETAAEIFIEVLHGVCLGATSERRIKLLAQEARLMVQQAETALAGPSLALVRNKLQVFEQRAGLNGPDDPAVGPDPVFRGPRAPETGSRDVSRMGA